MRICSGLALGDLRGRRLQPEPFDGIDTFGRLQRHNRLRPIPLRVTISHLKKAWAPVNGPAVFDELVVDVQLGGFQASGAITSKSVDLRKLLAADLQIMASGDLGDLSRQWLSAKTQRLKEEAWPAVPSERGSPKPDCARNRLAPGSFGLNSTSSTPATLSAP